MRIAEGAERGGVGVLNTGFGQINKSLQPAAGGGGDYDVKMILIIETGIRIKI